MRLERFDISKHKGLIEDWLRRRDIDPARLVKNLPKTGYVAYTDLNLPVAIACLRLCEGPLAMIDSLVTNPLADGHDRHEGIDLVITSLIVLAQEKGIEDLIAYSVDVSTLKRSKAHGFSMLPHVLIGLNLGES